MSSLNPARARRCPLWLAAGLLALFLWGGTAMAQLAVDPCTDGRTLYQAGSFAEARAALLECLATGGDAVEILLPLAVMGVREGRLGEALEFARRAVEIAPNDTEARYWYGRALLRADRGPDAREQWEHGLAVSADHPGILEGLARLALADGEGAKAYNLLKQLQMQGVDDAWLHILLAEIAAGKSLWPQALGHMQKALARGEPTVEDLIFGAELALLSGEQDEALTYGRRAVEFSPDSRTWGNLGQTYFALEEVDSAVVYFRRALTDPAADPRLRFNLANALEVSGRSLEAGEEFRRFLAEVPDDAMGHFNYGVHLEKQGRRSEAMAEIEQAIALREDLLQARVVKIQMLEAAGQWDEALVSLAALRERDRHASAELATWRERLLASRDEASEAAGAGRIHLLHLVLSDQEALTRAQADIAAGEEFEQVVMRYSTGPAAARGGDIGWVLPDEMRSEMAAVVRELGIAEISPPVAVGGLFHIFKRIP